MKATINKVENGYVVKHFDYNTEVWITHVFEYQDTEKAEVQTTVDMLWHINDVLGASTSRYSEARVQVSVVAGDKYEGKNNET